MKATTGDQLGMVTLRQDRLHHRLARALAAAEGVHRRPHHGAHPALGRGIDLAAQRPRDLRQAEADLLPRERQQDRVLVVEVLIERADADAGALGYGIGGEAGDAAGFENLSGGLQNGRRGLGRTRLARNSSFYFKGLAACGHGDPGSA